MRTLSVSEIIYGIHAIQALLKYTSWRLQEIFILKQHKNRNLTHLLKEQKIKIQLVNRQFLDKKSNGAAHQGIVAHVKPSPQYKEKYLLNLISKLDNPFFLILDNITDPHNLGACLRNADVAGVNAVIVPKNHSAPLNAAVKKVACGAAEIIPLIRVTNLARTMRLLQKENIWIIGTTRRTERTLYQSKITSRLALVMGSENQGMRQLTRKHCDELISIPMTGCVSSLNVSVAAGICLFEIARHRKSQIINPLLQ